MQLGAQLLELTVALADDLPQGGQLLAELNEEDRELLLDLMEEKKVSQGVPIFREGSEAEGMVLIVSGEARLESKRGGEPFLLGAGCTLGGLSLLLVGKREATAIAEAPCNILILPRNAFHRFVEDAPRAACRLIESITVDFATGVRDGLDALALGGAAELESRR